jgi:hypothetical protein
LTQLSLQIQTEIFPNELFPGAVMAHPGILAGPDTQKAPEFAGRFAALLDMAGTAQGNPAFGAAFLPPGSASFSPIREPDQLYDSRPPDAAQPFRQAADGHAESGAVSQKTEDPRADDGAEALREEAAADVSGGEFGVQAPSVQAPSVQAPSAQTPSAQAASEQASVALGFAEGPAAEGLVAEGREAGMAGSAEDAENAPARAKRGREKPKVPGEDALAQAEKIPGFEEGVIAGVEIDTNQKSAISGEPGEADEAAGAGVRLARLEGAEKPDGMVLSGADLAASLEDGAAAEKSGADLAGAETAESAAKREGPGQGADFSGAKAAAGAVPENAAAELAALPRQQKPLAPERAGAEKEGREEPGEARKSERRKLNLELRDFRTVKPKTDGPADGTAGGGNAENNDGRPFGDYVPNHGQEQEIIVDLKSQARSQAEVSYNRESRAQLSFRETLARELHENLNGDIVRHASVILRNGGEGLIRLSLRPEHLGNVKIRLEMSENKVVGQIVVESGEALRAFEQELRSLEQAFRDSGFEGASLEMSVSSDGRQGGGYREDGEDAPFFSERLAAHSYDTTSGAGGDTAAALRFAGGGRQVDVLA